MQIKRNPGWKFYHKGVDLYEKLTEKDSNGEYINQWKFAEYLRENKFASCLISLGSSKKQTSKDDSPVTSVNMNDYLVISTNGTYNNSEKGLDNLSTELQKTPMSCEKKEVVQMNHSFDDSCKIYCASIVSIRTPYPLVGSFTKTWVTAPTILPF